MRKHRRLKVFLIIACAIVVAVGLVRHFRRVDLERKLLKAVDLQSSMRYSSNGCIHWTDPLTYVSGYDILAAHVDPALWTPPSSWHSELKSLETIEYEQDITLQLSWFEEKRIALPEAYDAWCFKEIGRGGEVYENWRFVLGLHSPDGTLIIYHGHDLWSLDDMDRFDVAEEARK